MKPRWGIHEKNYIRENAGQKTDEEMAKELSKISGRQMTLASVRKMRQRMEIKKKHGRGRCELE